jgi:hypothetical protein
MVENSDIYLLILGDDYGETMPGTNLGPTEEEWRVARNLGKPTVVFKREGIKPGARQAAFVKRVEDYETGVWRYTFVGAGDLISQLEEALATATESSRPTRQGARVAYELGVASPGADPTTASSKARMTSNGSPPSTEGPDCQDSESITYAAQLRGPMPPWNVTPPSDQRAGNLRPSSRHFLASSFRSGVVPPDCSTRVPSEWPPPMVELRSTRASNGFLPQPSGPPSSVSGSSTMATHGLCPESPWKVMPPATQR